MHQYRVEDHKNAAFRGSAEKKDVCQVNLPARCYILLDMTHLKDRSRIRWTDDHTNPLVDVRLGYCNAAGGRLLRSQRHTASGSATAPD